MQFTTPTFVARAPIQSDGTYKVGSYKEGDGLPPGEYKVAIVSVDPGGKCLVDPKFGDSKTSGLSAVIEKTTHDFIFIVDRPSAEFYRLNKHD